MLHAPNWIADNPEEAEPWTYADAYALTGYFDGGFAREENANSIIALLEASLLAAENEAATLELTGEAREDYIREHRFDHANAQALVQFTEGGVLDSDGDTPITIGEHFVHHKPVADSLGIPMVMYEGGTHVVMPEAVWQHPLGPDFYEQFNYGLVMAELYEQAYQTWVNFGGKRFNFFVEAYPGGRYGHWGAARYVGDTNPRLTKILELANRDNESL